MEEDRCLHGMIPNSCAFCRPPAISKPKRVPRLRPREEHTVHGSGIELTYEAKKYEYVIIYAGKPDHPGWRMLSDSTVTVHIVQHPFLWAIEKIIEQCPKLEVIQMPARMHKKLTESHHKLCASRNVALKVGYHRPDLIWGDDENRSPHYTKQRKFFLNLTGEQKQLWDELLLAKFPSALLTARYFCLNGEEFVTQQKVAEEFELERNSSTSLYVNGVINYLDHTFEVSKMSTVHSHALRDRITRLRKYLQEGVKLKDAYKELQLKVDEVAKSHDTESVISLPRSFPLSRFELFLKVARAFYKGRLTELQRFDSRLYQVLTFRFGFTADHEHFTLEQIGKALGGLTRERVRQLEADALKFLDIKDDD